MNAFSGISLRDTFRPTFGSLLATISLTNLANAKKAAIIDRTSIRCSVLREVSRQRSLMNKYLAILTPVLSGRGYTPTETYRDGFGGLVVDFLRAESRICIALTDKELQFIFFEDGKLQSKTFGQPDRELLLVLEFTQSRLL